MAHRGNVQETIDAAEIDERAICLHAANDAFTNLSDGEFRPGFLALLRFLFLNDRAAREDDVVIFTIHFGDANRELLIEKDGEVLMEFGIDLTGGHEGARGADLEFEAAFVDAGDDGFNGVTDLQSFPRTVLNRALASKNHKAFAGVIPFEDELIFLSDLDAFFFRGGFPFGRRDILVELFDGANALAFAADIDENVAAANAGDAPFLMLSGLMPPS